MKVHTINFLKSTVVATVGVLLAASPSFAATIVNGNFEIESVVAPELGTGGFLLVGPGQTIPGPASWIALEGTGGGGAAYLGRTVFNNNGAISRTVQLNGTNTRGGISTILSNLVFNEQVDVTFDLSGNVAAPGSPNATVPVVDVTLSNSLPAVIQRTLGAVPVFTGFGFNSPGLDAPVGGAVANLGFQTFVASFLYTGQGSTATLSFISRSGADLGPIIDNVRVSAVPFEFSPVTGFIAGGILFGSYKLVNRKKSAA